MLSAVIIIKDNHTYDTGEIQKNSHLFLKKISFNRKALAAFPDRRGKKKHVLVTVLP
jgi:hypothetical protein